MNVKASGGSPNIQPQLYRTTALATILQAEQQDRFLQLGELNQLVAFLNSGDLRLSIANVLTQNANVLVSSAADKIFVGGSAISYLTRPQVITQPLKQRNMQQVKAEVSIGTTPNNPLQYSDNTSTPPGFKPISINRYGKTRMNKSLRDLDWFLRYLTYAIITGDPNILKTNIRGLRELIDNACSSAAAIVALREMRQKALKLFLNDVNAFNLVQEYFGIIINEFEAAKPTDKLQKQQFKDLQGLRLPQTYFSAQIPQPKFVMKTSLSASEKDNVIRACYRQIFQRDIKKAYSIQFIDLESQVKNGQISIKEFVRKLGQSDTYVDQFVKPFVDSRVLELAFRHFLGRGPSSLTEFQRYFAVLAKRGICGLIDELINSREYADYFGEETVPYQRKLGEEAQECSNWGPKISLLNYGSPFKKIPQFITLFGSYKQALPDQHPYGGCNDPILIQFGAIFKQRTINPNTNLALFGKDTRRLLTRKGPGIYNQISRPDLRAKETGSLGPVIFKSEPQNNPDTLIKAIYLRVFGRLMYEEEQILFKELESQFINNKLSVKNFIKELTKSATFRKLYWDPLYVCKAIEFIHNRLLGRPTYGRQEINQYFEISYKKGYYSMINAILDSTEYIQTFGDHIVPYERYITAETIAMRELRQNHASSKKIISTSRIITNRFIVLGQTRGISSIQSIKQKVSQGVSSKRDQTIIFKKSPNSSQKQREILFRVACIQIFEREVHQLSIGHELYNIEKEFLNNQLTIKELVLRLGKTGLYCKEFYQPFPNTQVIELGTKHFLGRAPNTQEEIRYYNQILASEGWQTFIQVLVDSSEYKTVFGNGTIPYRRFPTLPASNFPNTEKLYNKQTKQDMKPCISSF